MAAAEVFEGLARKQERALHIPTEVIGRDLVHQILNRLGRALAPNLVIAQPFADALRDADRSHPAGRGAHRPNYESNRVNRFPGAVPLPSMTRSSS